MHPRHGRMPCLRRGRRDGSRSAGLRWQDALHAQGQKSQKRHFSAGKERFPCVCRGERFTEAQLRWWILVSLRAQG